MGIVAVLVVSFVLLLIMGALAGVYYTKSHLLSEELTRERRETQGIQEKLDYLEGKAESLQMAYVDLVLTGYMRVGPNDMRELVDMAKDLRDVSNGVGGEEDQTPPQ